MGIMKLMLSMAYLKIWNIVILIILTCVVIIIINTKFLIGRRATSTLSVTVSYRTINLPICEDMHCLPDCHLSIVHDDSSTQLTLNGSLHLWVGQSQLQLAVLDQGKCHMKQKLMFNFDNLNNSLGAFRNLTYSFLNGTIVAGTVETSAIEYLDHVSKDLQESLNVTRQGQTDSRVSFVWKIGFPSFAQYGVYQPRVTWQTSFIVGRPRHVDTNYLDMAVLEKKYTSVQPGIGWRPMHCHPRWNVAIIVPYRNRSDHLKAFLNNIIPFMEEQLIAFKIYIINQAGDELFNRASLMNIGHIEARQTAHYDCYVFTDIDLIPEDSCNLYACDAMPRHLSVALAKLNYRIQYQELFGGATVLNENHLDAINGFPNVFFAWGGEDDNIYERVKHAGYAILRYPDYISRYITLKHVKHEGNPKSGRKRKDVYQLAKYQQYDGTSSLEYSIIKKTDYQLYTLITVKIPGPRNVTEAQSYVLNKEEEYSKLVTMDKVDNSFNKSNIIET